jgi:hypothetical protein
MSVAIPSTSVAEEIQGFTKHPGQRLQQVFDEALETIEPIFQDSQDENVSTRMYRVMDTLHRAYPHLNEGELEALLTGLLKHKRNAGAH